jgi:hypothetical protein
MWADFLGDIDWGSVAAKVAPAAIGSYVASNANQKAAKTLAEASDRSAQQLVAGNQSAQAKLQTIADRTAPAVTYLKQVMSDTSLTPAQQQRVQDTRRLEGQQLSSRLGGRSATAVATRSATNLENSIYDANRARSDNAAGTLAGQNQSAITNSAQLDTGLGQNLSRVTQSAGENMANADLSTGQLQAKTIGDVMSPIRTIIATDQKGTASDRDRNSYSANFR